MLINKLPLAEEDLINLWIFGYQKWGVLQADSYLERLEDKFNSLSEMPEKYGLRKALNPAVRICPHGSHIIIYTIEGDSILLIRVLHKTMDVELHL